MRVAVTSDTHGRQNWVMPPCDVFLHAGDITGRGSIEETSRFAARLRDEMSSPHGPRHAIIVPGNHDQCFELFPTPVRELFGENVHVLLDEAVTLDGVRFYGSPWTPPFMRWHFMADERRLASLFANMPDTLDVLVTHGPPRGILDPGWQEAHVGSTALADAVAARKITHHVFGHLHDAGGQSIQRGTTIFHKRRSLQRSIRAREPAKGDRSAALSRHRYDTGLYTGKCTLTCTGKHGLQTR